MSELERVVLRRLAVFVGHFTLDAALAVVTSASVDQSRVFGAIDSLVAKSMVATRPIGAMMRYRLLDTTRAYTLGIPVDDAEFADLAVRHATYYRRWLEQNGTEWPTLSSGTEPVSYTHLDVYKRQDLFFGMVWHGSGAPALRERNCFIHAERSRLIKQN